MKQTMTASERLAKIENFFFKGQGLSRACKLSGEERKSYVFAQVERLLATEHGSSPLAVWLSEQFWTADAGREMMYENDPLFSKEGKKSLTDKETARLELILGIAGLCHDIGLYQQFDLKQVLGFRNKWWVSNKRLVEWLKTTEYEHMAMCVAYIMRKQAIDVFFDTYYMPAQDEMAEIFSSEFHELLRNPNDTKIPPRAYVDILLETMFQIERHWQRGRRRKLSPEVVILHDEIYGLIPLQFSSFVLQAAQTLYDYMNNEMFGLGVSKPRMNSFADKVREVRTEFLAEGWITDDSLSFGYLMAHAERCCQGHWHKEDFVL